MADEEHAADHQADAADPYTPRPVFRVEQDRVAEPEQQHCVGQRNSNRGPIQYEINHAPAIRITVFSVFTVARSSKTAKLVQ